LNNEDQELRIAAYEALEKLNDPIVKRRQIADKFELHQAPSAYPLIYVTQQKQPRVVVLGDHVELRRPLFVNGWSGRLIINSTSETGPVSTMYRDPVTGKAQRAEISPELEELVELLAHESTPEAPAPGFDLSYSEVVGALFAVVDAGGVDAQFWPESDRLSLALVRSLAQTAASDRPELSEDGPVDSLSAAAELAEPEEPTENAEPVKETFVVPLTVTPTLKSGKAGKP
jgi:hypothetical protein